MFIDVPEFVLKQAKAAPDEVKLVQMKLIFVISWRVQFAGYRHVTDKHFSAKSSSAKQIRQYICTRSSVWINIFAIWDVTGYNDLLRNKPIRVQ